VKSLQCFLAPVYACVGDGQAKPWFASKTPRLLVKSDRFIETTHFAIERRKRRLAIGHECRVELHCAFTGRDCFVVQTEISKDLAGEVTHTYRGRLSLRSLMQV